MSRKLSIDQLSRSLVKRFWGAVVRSDNLDDCWHWARPCHSGGYGILGYGRHKLVFAHRLSWQLHYGQIPEKLCVLHKCDNPPCCNPRHLFLGTHEDNALDRDRKGRTQRCKGEDNSHVKLTEVNVREIFQRANRGERQDMIAEEFHIHPAHVSSIKLQKTWRHLWV